MYTRDRRTFYLLISLVVLVMAAVGCDDSHLLGEIMLGGEPGTTEGGTSLHIDGADAPGPHRAVVALRNDGSQTLSIASIAFSEPESFSVFADDISSTLPAGETTHIEVAFHPAAPGFFRSVVRIYLDGNVSPIEFVVTGER